MADVSAGAGHRAQGLAGDWEGRYEGAMNCPRGERTSTWGRRVGPGFGLALVGGLAACSSDAAFSATDLASEPGPVAGGPAPGVDAAVTGATCVSPFLDEPWAAGVAVPLRLHRGRSDLDDSALCSILSEANSIWWRQAGVCFEVEVTLADEPSVEGLDAWFESKAPLSIGVEANGVYVGPHAIYSLDSPTLRWAEPASDSPAARTLSHELGHALGLGHQDCGSACDGLLMRSGTRGIRITSAPPASLDEVTAARAAAALLEGARSLQEGQRCQIRGAGP